MRKLYCVGWGRSYANGFRDVELTGDFETPKFQIEDADIVFHLFRCGHAGQGGQNAGQPVYEFQRIRRTVSTR